MPDWAIVLVAAFGGGLAGAVLQPASAYVMDRLRSGDRIRKNRERHLRRMVEANIRDARAAAHEALVAIGRASGPAPSQRSQPPQGWPLWQPNRIPDPELRELAYRYDKVRTDLRVGARFGNEQVKENLDKLVTEIEGLEVRITCRMDGLKWPEVDD